MKKIFLFITTLSLLSVTSCSNDDGGKNPSDEGNNPNVYTKYDNKTQTPNNCVLVLWGVYDEGLFWSLIPFIGENEEDIETSSSYVDYEFLTDGVPASNNCIFNNVFSLTVDGAVIDITSVSDGSIKVTDVDEESITFEASATVNGKSLATKYSGRVLHYDLSEETRPSNEILTKEERKQIISELLAK